MCILSLPLVGWPNIKLIKLKINFSNCCYYLNYCIYCDLQSGSLLCIVVSFRPSLTTDLFLSGTHRQTQLHCVCAMAAHDCAMATWHDVSINLYPSIKPPSLIDENWGDLTTRWPFVRWLACGQTRSSCYIVGSCIYYHHDDEYRKRKMLLLWRQIQQQKWPYQLRIACSIWCEELFPIFSHWATSTVLCKNQVKRRQQTKPNQKIAWINKCSKFAWEFTAWPRETRLCHIVVRA